MANIIGFDEEEGAAPAYSQMFGTPVSARDIDQMVREKLEIVRNKVLKQLGGYDTSVSAQQNLSNMVDDQVYTRDDGSQYQIKYVPSIDAYGEHTVTPTEVEFKGPTRNLYMDNTADGNMKLGLARTDQGGYTGRYDKNLHPTWKTAGNGELAGVKGVTPADGPLLNVVAPYNEVTGFEYGVHSNPEQIANRAMGLGPKTDETRSLFGAGQTEYTTPNAPMQNADYYRTRETPLLTEDTPLPHTPKPYKEYKGNSQQKWLEEESKNNIDIQLGGALGSRVGTTLGKLAEFTGEIMEVGGDVLSLPGNLVEGFGKWQEYYNKAHPMDRSRPASNAIMGMQEWVADNAQKLGKWMNTDNIFAETLDEEGAQIQVEQKNFRDRDGWNKLAGYDPAPVDAYNTRFADNIENGNYVDAVSGLFSYEAVPALLNSAPEMILMANPLGLGAVMGANTNKNLNDLYANTNGKATKGQIATSIALSVVGTYLDRIGDKAVLSATKATIAKMPAAIRKKIFEAYENPLKAVGITAASVTGKTAVEGGTEYAQTIMENKAVDPNKMNLNITSKENREGLKAMASGLGSGGLVTSVNPAINTVETGLNAVRNVGKEKRKNTIAENMTQEQADILKEAEVLQTEYETATPERQEEINTRINELNTKLSETTAVTPEVEVPTETPVETEVETEAPIPKEKEMTTLGKMEKLDSEIEELSKPMEDSTNEERAATHQRLKEAKAERKEVRKAVEAEYIPQLEAKYVKEGMNVDEAKKKAIDTVKRLTSPGMVQTIAKAGNKIAIEPINSATMKDKTNKKPQTFNPLKVTTEVFKKAADGKLTFNDVKNLLHTSASALTVSTVNALILGSDTNKEIRKVQKEIRSTMQNNPKVKEMVQNLLNTSDADVETDALQIAAMVLTAVNSGIEAETNIRANKGMNPSSTKYARSLGMNSALGKALLNSDGVAITGSEQDTAIAYAEIGNKMFDIAEELGMIKREYQKVAVQDLVDPNTGETLYDQKKLSEVYSSRGAKVSSETSANGKKNATIRDKVLMINGNRASQMYGMSVLSRLVNPTNMALPTPEADLRAITDRGVSKLHKETIKNLNKMKFHIKPEFIQLIKDIKKQIGDSTLDKAFYHNKDLKALVGLDNSNAALIKANESGRNMSRKRLLRDLIDNIDILEEMSKNGGMHFQYEGAINHRIHLLQTVLDFQGDKRIARQILAGKEYTTDKDGAVTLLNALSEETGMTRDEILNPTGELKTTLDEYKEGDNGLTTVVAIGELMGESNPIKAMSLFLAIRDVYVAKDKDKITTDYMVEYDATASGVTNTLMNLSGNPKVQEILKLMGVGPDAVSLEDRIDPYQHQNNVFTQENNNIGGKKALGTMNEYISILDMGKGKLEKLKRDLAKYPVLQWFYGESPTNTKTGMAREMAQNLALAGIQDYNQKAVDKINQITGKSYTLDTNSAKIMKSSEAESIRDLIDNDREYTVVDTETTGLSDDSDIIQIAIIRMKGNKQIGKPYTIHLSTKQTIEEGAENTHGISHKELNTRLSKETGSNADKLNRVIKLMGNNPVVAYNAEFDIKKISKQSGKPISNKIVDPVKVSRSVNRNVPGASTLENMAARYGIEYGAHDAAEDIIATSKMMEHVLKEYDNKRNNTETLINDITNEDVSKVADYYKENFTDRYVGNLDKTFPGVSAYRSTMDEIYAILKDSGEWDGTIGTAMAALEIKRINENEKLSQKDKDTKIAELKSKRASLQKMKTTLADNTLEGEPVQVNKMYDNKTSLKVSPQHIMDAAQMLMTMSDYTGTFDDAVMTVHDAIYGNANHMDSIKGMYEKNMLDTATEYDFVQVGLDAAKEAASKMTDVDEKQIILDRIAKIEEANKETMKAKAEFLGNTENIDMFGQLGKDTTKKPKPTVKPKAKKTVAQKFKEDAKKWIEDSGNKMELVKLLQTIKVSDTHKALLEKLLTNLNSVDGVEIEAGKDYAGKDNVIYVEEIPKVDPRTHKDLTPDTLVEILAHEMDHAVNFNYLQNNMNKGEVKYLLNQVRKLYNADKTGLSQKALDRVNYILNSSNPTNDENLDSLYAVSEFISVMRNEPDVAGEIAQVLYKAQGKKGLERLMSSIMKMVKKAYEALKGMKPEDRSNLFTEGTYNTMGNTVKAMEVVMLNAEAYGRIGNKDSISPGVVAKATKEDMYRYASNIVDRHNNWMADMVGIWGETFMSVVSPVVGKGHQELKGKFAIYKGASNLIAHHMYDTKFAQEMRSTIGLSQDYDKKLMNKLLSISTTVQQDTADILTKEMIKLEGAINKELKGEDREKLFRAMRTGIGALGKYPKLRKKMLKGEMTTEEVMKDLNIDEGYKDKIESVANYYVTGKMENGWINTHRAGMIDPKYEAAVAAVAFSQTKGYEVTSKLSYPLRKELIGLYTTLKHLNDEINTLEREYSGQNDTNYYYDDDFDGHYTMDVTDKHEFAVLNEREMSSSEYSSENDWVVIKEAKNGIDGIVARKSYHPGYTPGVGLNANKFKNGFYLDGEKAKILSKKLSSMNESDKQKYLNDNQIIEGSNGQYRYLVDVDTSINKLGMKKDVANSAMRTYAHNKELIEMGAVRGLIMSSATTQINTQEDMDKLEDQIQASKTDENIVLPMFLKINDEMLREFDKYPEGIKLKYMTPNASISTFNQFNRKITMVKKGESSALIGHPNASIFGNRSLAKWEKGWKEFVVLAKQHMIVTDISKLAVDAASNLGILETRGVSTIEIARRFKTGWKAYNQLSAIRGEIVVAELKVRTAEEGTKSRERAEQELEKLNKKLRASHFYDAFNYGFVQSYSTSLVLDNFDSVSGLQKNIDEIVEQWTKDDGNPNELYKAIKWWQEFGASKGFTVDSLITAAVELSGKNDTTIGQEMIKMAKRLKNDRDADSVARYVSNIIGGPASEVVKVGSAAMVTTDVLSKYTLAMSLMNKRNPKTKKQYTKEEAYMEANDTFIDYRRNMPAEVKALSDYAVLMFPSFWMKVQTVIARMVRYQPSTAIGGYAIADYLGMNGANILDTNILNKLSDGTVMNDPTRLIDWENLFWFL